MIVRFTATDPDNHSFQFAEPFGWDSATLDLDRHSEYHSLIESFSSGFQTYGKNADYDGGRDWLLNVENVYGVDALISILVEIDPNEDGNFEELYKGNLAVGKFIESLDTDHFLQIAFDQKTFWSKFTQRFDSKVNPQSRADLDGNTVVPINFKAVNLPSQKIIKSYTAYQKYNSVISITSLDVDNNLFFLFGFDSENLKEIDEQSSITPSKFRVSNNSSFPDSSEIVPFFTVIDEGEFVIENIFLTLSTGNYFGDPNIGGSFSAQKNYKNAGLEHRPFNLYLQKNDENPIIFNKKDRLIPNSFLRNDGVVENLYVGNPSGSDDQSSIMPYVTDFNLPNDYSLKLNKYDSVKIFAVGGKELSGYSNVISDIFFWGTDGWSHDSGSDQIRYGQGSYFYDTTVGGLNFNFPSNQGNFAYGGIFSATGSFPDHIDNDAGTGLDIKASQWWTVAEPGGTVAGGIVVTSDNVLTALIDMAAGSPACQNPANWHIGTKTPYEGLEAYARKDTSFQGYYDPTITNDFPATGVKALDRWYITSLLTNLGGAYVDSTYIIQALKDSPTIRADWWISTRDDYDKYWLADRQFQGNWDASVNLYPANRYDGSAIKADDIWIISVAGIFGGIGGVPVDVGYVIRARVDAPGQTDANWDVFTFDDWVIYAESHIVYYSGAQITFNTTYQDTIGQGFLVHDLLSGILDRICGQSGLLYSPFLGNPYTSKPYISTGCASLLGIFKGLQVRGYDLVEKPFFISFKEFWEGLDPIYPLGLGYDKDNLGNDILVIDDRANFYNPTMIVLLSNVQNIKRNYDNDQQYNSVEIGYQKWQSQAATGIGTPTGIDDPQTKQTRNTRFRNIGKKISILSSWIAASLTFETTRRVTNKQSANYTYDNDTFIVALKSNGDGTFKPELNENFSEVDNLTNADTRYNIRLSTTRNFLRHLRYLSGCLQDYLTSFFRFASGEGNYRMSSKITTSCPDDNTGVLIAENDDIQVSNDPIHRAELFEIVHYLDWEDYKTIRENRGNAIGISQTDSGHVPFFIKTLKYNLVSGQVNIVAWPKNKFTIQVIESPATTSGRRHEARFEERYD